MRLEVILVVLVIALVIVWGLWYWLSNKRENMMKGSGLEGSDGTLGYSQEDTLGFERESEVQGGGANHYVGGLFPNMTQLVFNLSPLGTHYYTTGLPKARLIQNELYSFRINNTWFYKYGVTTEEAGATALKIGQVNPPHADGVPVGTVTTDLIMEYYNHNINAMINGWNYRQDNPELSRGTSRAPRGSTKSSDSRPKTKPSYTNGMLLTRVLHSMSSPMDLAEVCDKHYTHSICITSNNAALTSEYVGRILHICELAGHRAVYCYFKAMGIFMNYIRDDPNGYISGLQVVNANNFVQRFQNVNNKTPQELISIAFCSSHVNTADRLLLNRYYMPVRWEVIPVSDKNHLCAQLDSFDPDTMQLHTEGVKQSECFTWFQPPGRGLCRDPCTYTPIGFSMVNHLVMGDLNQLIIAAIQQVGNQIVPAGTNITLLVSEVTVPSQPGEVVQPYNPPAIPLPQYYVGFPQTWAAWLGLHTVGGSVPGFNQQCNGVGDFINVPQGMVRNFRIT